MSNPEVSMMAIIDAVNARGIHAEYHHTGGGVFCILVDQPERDRYFYFGFSDGVLGWDECHDTDIDRETSGEARDLTMASPVEALADTIAEVVNQ